MGSYDRYCFIICFYHFAVQSSEKGDSVRLASFMVASVEGLILAVPYSTIFHDAT